MLFAQPPASAKPLDIKAMRAKVKPDMTPDALVKALGAPVLKSPVSAAKDQEYWRFEALDGVLLATVATHAHALPAPKVLHVAAYYQLAVLRARAKVGMTLKELKTTLGDISPITPYHDPHTDDNYSIEASNGWLNFHLDAASGKIARFTSIARK